MGNVIVCKTKSTKIPFIFENTKVEVYSYEELCYYIYNNGPIISLDNITSRFTRWIDEELHLFKLSENVNKLIEKKAILMDILVEILTFEDYYTLEEIKAFIKNYERYRKSSSFERDKIKGDCFLAYKRYIKAIDIYEDILSMKEDISDNILIGNIYHNRGIALANNLELDESRISFLTAFTYNENMESLKEFFLVLASEGDEGKVRSEMEKYNLPEEFLQDLFEEFADSREDIRNMSIYNKVEKAMYNKKQGNIVAYTQRMDAIINQLKQEFREQTI